MKILKPTIRGLRPFAGDTITPSVDWADSAIDWADSTAMWGAQVEYREKPQMGDIRLDSSTVGDIKINTPTLKHD